MGIDKIAIPVYKICHCNWINNGKIIPYLNNTINQESKHDNRSRAVRA